MDTITSKTPQETHFEFIGGHVCLDLTNTVGGMPRGQHEREDLTRYTDLVSWSQQANLVTENEAEVLLRKAARNEGEALAVLRRAHTLREAIYHIFTALIAGQQPVGSDLETLNKELRKGTIGASLMLTQTVLNGNGGKRKMPSIRCSDPLLAQQQHCSHLTSELSCANAPMHGANGCLWMRRRIIAANGAGQRSVETSSGFADIANGNTMGANLTRKNKDLLYRTKDD
ncbi:MAG: ABATE domain-containing protein [Ktedonobacteraceae bacterium]|nr:ABATE domain-containing protein [Ktedonobacteraceae bacterium]